jgi:hypothetical protein
MQRRCIEQHVPLHPLLSCAGAQHRLLLLLWVVLP